MNSKIRKQLEQRNCTIATLRTWGIDARPTGDTGDGRSEHTRAHMLEIVYVRRTKPSSDGKILILDTEAIARDEVHLAEMVRRAGATGVVLSTNHGTPTNIHHRYTVETWREPDGDAPPPEGTALGHPPEPATTAADLISAATIVFGSPDRDNAWDLRAGANGGSVMIPAALVLEMATATLEEDERLEALAQAALDAGRLLLELDADHGRQIYVDCARAITDALAWRC